MRTYYLLSAIVAFAASVPANAAGFTGPRVEVRGGWDRVALKLKASDGTDTYAASAHKDGYTIGGEVGFDWQLSQTIVAGSYAGADFPHTRVCDEIYGNDEACLKAPRSLTAGVRLGAVVSPAALFYVKAGYSNGRLKVIYRDFADPTNNGSDHVNRDGLHAGLGGEFAVGTHAYLKAEYLYTNYKAYKIVDGSSFVRLDGDRSQVLAGVGIRF